MHRETIVIGEDGSVRLPNWVKEQLRRRKGEWRLVPSVDPIIILQRANETTTSNAQRATLCGELVGTATLLDVMSMINTARWTGILAVLDGLVSKSVSFKKGEVKAASSNQARDRMGEIIYRYGAVTRDQLDDAMREVTQTRKIGRVLVEKNYIDAHKLWHFIRLQVEEIFYSLLQFKRGSFYFFPRDESEFPSALTLSTQELLMEGVRRIDELGYMRERIPSGRTILIQVKPIPDTDTKLDKKERKIFQFIDGVKDVIELARLSELGEFDATKGLFQLLQSNYIRVIDDGPMGDGGVGGIKSEGGNRLAEVIGAFNQIFRRIYSEVKRKGREAEFRSGLASFFAGASSYARLFSSISALEDGSLPSDSLLANLDAISAGNQSDFLYQALNEYLFFQLFAAGEGLDKEEEQRLQRVLNEGFRDPE
jgi:hypothetical protein